VAEAAIHRALVWAYLGLAVATFVVLRRVVAPYGRHQRSGWGWEISSRVGWVIMELPACLGFAGIYLQGRHAGDTVPVVLISIWQIHYVYRTLVYPWRMREPGRRMPIVVAALGCLLQCCSSYLNARWISHLVAYPDEWLQDPRLVVGLMVFVVGLFTHMHADGALRALRPPGTTGYAIPQGGLYRWVSCPNYLGEIVQWLGWAMATWSLPGLAFALSTLANLVPRARSHHAWYRDRFPEYPAERRALIPLIW
jgi:protein-S-isoprenylcysteine O-methyltransferase Ste14